MTEHRAARTGLLVRQAFVWCLVYFAVKALSWLVLPELGEPLRDAAPKMLPASILITAVAILGWFALRRHTVLLGPLLTALLVGYVVASLVAVGVPRVAPIVMFGLIVFDYIVPLFLAVAAWSASRVLAKAERGGGPGKRPVRPVISLDGFEADGDERGK